MSLMDIQLDNIIMNNEALTKHFEVTGFPIPKKTKMKLSEIQLDEIEDALGGTDNHTEVNQLYRNALNLKSVAKSLLSRTNDLVNDTYWKRCDIEIEQARLKQEKEDV